MGLDEDVIERPEEHQWALAAARRLMVEIQALSDGGHHIETIAASDQAEQRFGDTNDPDVRERLAYALLLKGLSLSALERDNDAIQVYHGLIDRLGDSAEPKTRRHVAWALNNRAFALKQLGQREEAVAVYDELIARFRDATEPEVRLPRELGSVERGCPAEGAIPRR